MLLFLAACGLPARPAPPPPVPCLDIQGPPGENTSQLWNDLSKWAFAQDPEIPSSDVITAAEAEALLDKAAREVPGLDSAEAWHSAGRYFQAENFHGLEDPACARGDRLAAARR